MFLPTTPEEMKQLGWDRLDVILISGDSYIDSPHIGVSLIGRVLFQAGYRVGIIAQPDTETGKDVGRLGEPGLFWGVTGGCVDSMVANRTATGRKRKSDDFTPGGKNTRRPDRATIIYCNLIRRHFKKTSPIVIGGIEASLRRIAHYDFWTDRVRRSILLDAKADYLLYGMAERSVLEFAECVRDGRELHKIRGLCYLAGEVPEDSLRLPSFEAVSTNKHSFTEMFHTFYKNNDPVTAKALAQKYDNRYLLHNPPAVYLSEKELDAVHDMDFERELHPFYRRQGDVKALETIRYSITTHRGCYGECHYCAIAVHQGRTVRSRSERSILEEAKRIAAHPKFKGMIYDVGGPTANMYGIECGRKNQQGCCQDKRCLYPKVCPTLKVNHRAQISLLESIRKIPGVRKVVVASGLRTDMVLADKDMGEAYLNALIRNHTSGQLKVAAEHSVGPVLDAMGRPDGDSLLQFSNRFRAMNRKEGKDQFLTYYLIAAHPGCTAKDMRELQSFVTRELQVIPEQVQIFTPTPSTYSTLMYYTERNPFTGKAYFVEKTVKGREKQKSILGTPGRSSQRFSRVRKR
ncbi:MAG: YgiQ family radical SAM protein [Acidobacteriota bacterium]